MNFKELQAEGIGRIQNAQAEVTGKIQHFKEFATQLRKEHSESDNTVVFVKTAFTREILEKKERIPGAIIGTWIFLLLIFSYDWTFGMNWAMVFNLGVLPFLIYYIFRSIREAPSE